MKITCHSCGAKYTVSDDKVQGKTVKIKCRKCGTTILVNSQGAVDASAGGAEAAAAADAGSYLVNVAEGDQRSLSVDEIVREYNAGVITGDTYVWSDGMSDWQPLQDVEAIVSALNQAVAPTVTPAPTGTPGPAYAPAAAAGPSGEAVASAVEPARAKREPSRVDLFSGSPQNDRATGSPLFGSSNVNMASAPAPTGQRDENSVLFSLSALTAKTQTPAPGRAAASREDSGLIDLKALAASAQTSSKPAPSAMADVDAGIFPLGAPVLAAAPPPVVSSMTPEAAPKKGSGALFIVLGILIGGAAIAGVFVLMKGGDDEKKTAGAETATTAAQAPPPPTEKPSAAPPPEPPPSAAASASASASVKVAYKGPVGPKKPGDKPPGDKPPGDKPPGEKPPAVAKQPCNCAPTDLTCAMNCSLKKK